MLSLFCYGAFAQTKETSPECFTIEKLYEGNAKISSYHCDYQSINIPSKINGLKVKVIGAGAFAGRKLISVLIPDGVEIIETRAFHQCYLEQVSLPVSIEIIESFAFWYGELSEVRLPKNLRELGYGAFSTNKIKNIVLPDTVTKIGPAVFYKNNLETAILSSGLKEIPDMAFWGNKLKSIVIPKGIRSIGEVAFADNLLFKVILPESIEVIRLGAFRNNLLEEITFPSNLKLIGEDAFFQNLLDKIRLPEKVELVEKNAFAQNLASYAEVPGKTYLKSAFDPEVQVTRIGPDNSGQWAKYNIVREVGSVREELINLSEVFLAEDQRDYILRESVKNKQTGLIKETSKVIDPRLVSLDTAKEQSDLCEKRGGQIELQSINGKNIKTCRYELASMVFLYAEVPFGFYLKFKTIDDDFISYSEKTQLLDFGKY